MKVNSKGIRWDRHQTACDCDKIIDVLVLRNKNKQASVSILEDVVASGDLDYLCHSKVYAFDGLA